MILVTLGTQDKEFPRLLKMVDECIELKLINEPVIAQIGNTKYSSKNMQLYTFLSPDELTKYIKDSSYIIMHGGVGSIFNALNYHKKIIAVARLKKYHEHVNDHQLEIIKEFTKEGLLLNGTNDLKSAIKNLSTFTPKEYTSNNNNFIKLITDYIDNND